MVLWIPLEASHPLLSKKSMQAFPKPYLRASLQGRASSNDSANFRLDRCPLWLTKQGVLCLQYLFQVTTKRQGQFLNITLQLFPLLQTPCCASPCCQPAGSMESSKQDFPLQLLAWQRGTENTQEGKSCFTLGTKIACGTIQLAKVPQVATPSCRGLCHAQSLNPRHCSSLARKPAQAGNNYAFNVWKRGDFFNRARKYYSNV